MTVSKFHLESAFEHATKAATAAGLDTDGWRLDPGSRAVGKAYRLTAKTQIIDVRLGSSTVEAYNALHAMARAWLMVAEAEADQPDRREWGKMLRDAERLSTEDLERHASVSTRNRHRCENCFTCACAATLAMRQMTEVKS